LENDLTENEASRRDSFANLLRQSTPVKAHLIGVRGAGMRSLAACLQAKGWQLTGSDAAPASGMAKPDFFPVFHRHAAAHLSPEVEVVIHSLAVPAENPEMQAAVEQGCLILSYAEALGGLSEQIPTIAVAGTHGKTTTSSLLSHILAVAETPHLLVNGGRFLPNAKSANPSNSPEWLVAESCEFRRSFLKIQPKIAILLSVEADHFDCYPDEASLVAAFGRFCQKIEPSGVLLVNAACPRATEAAREASCRIVWFDAHADPLRSTADKNRAGRNRWTVGRRTQTEAGVEFELFHRDQQARICRLPLWGEHQISNAVAAIAAAVESGTKLDTAAAALESFPGLERRFQSRGVHNGWRLIDDYAHHPTEIRATLAAARQKFPRARLVVAFQPHQIQRTEHLMSEFAESLCAADQVFVLPVFAARETADQRVVSTSQQLGQRGRDLGGEFEFCPSLDQLRFILDDKRFAGPEQGERVFLTLGAGDIDRIFYELPG